MKRTIPYPLNHPSCHQIGMPLSTGRFFQRQKHCRAYTTLVDGFTHQAWLGQREGHTDRLWREDTTINDFKCNRIGLQPIILIYQIGIFQNRCVALIDFGLLTFSRLIPA
ncbi:hypothetical protein D3C77_533240 [compost metagenome]